MISQKSHDIAAVVENNDVSIVIKSEFDCCIHNLTIKHHVGYIESVLQEK